MGKLSPRWRLSHPVVNIFFIEHVQRSTALSPQSPGKQTWHVLAAEASVPLLPLLVAPLWRSSLILSVPRSPNVPSPCQVTPLSWQPLYNVCARTAAKNCVFSPRNPFFQPRWRAVRPGDSKWAPGLISPRAIRASFCHTWGIYEADVYLLWHLPLVCAKETLQLRAGWARVVYRAVRSSRGCSKENKLWKVMLCSWKMAAD